MSQTKYIMNTKGFYAAYREALKELNPPECRRNSICIRFTMGEGLIFCPLTLVCLHLTGIKCSTWRYRNVASLIGLNPAIADHIALAADGEDAYHGHRQRLLKPLSDKD